MLVVAIAFFVVPVNRKPSSATAWLLLITIAPLIGVLIFLLIGNPKLSPRRRQLQREMSGLIVQAIDRADDDPAAAPLLAPPGAPGRPAPRRLSPAPRRDAALRRQLRRAAARVRPDH